MRKIYTNGEVDFSDEGSGAKQIVSEVEVNHFYSKLSKRHQIILTHLLVGETEENIARFLGVSQQLVSWDVQKIRKNKDLLEMKKIWGIKDK